MQRDGGKVEEMYTYIKRSNELSKSIHTHTAGCVYSSRDRNASLKGTCRRDEKWQRLAFTRAHTGTSREGKAGYFIRGNRDKSKISCSLMRRFVIIPIRTMRIFPGQWFSTCESSVKGKIIEKFCVNRIICILMMEFCFGGAGSLFAIICFNF